MDPLCHVEVAYVEPAHDGLGPKQIVHTFEARGDEAAARAVLERRAAQAGLVIERLVVTPVTREA